MIDGVDDKTEFEEMDGSLEHCGFSDEERESIYYILAGILHLGNVEFDTTGSDNSNVRDKHVVETCADMFMVDPTTLRTKLITQLIKVRGEQYEKPLKPQEACYARDALAKAAYSRMFDWLVSRVNDGLAVSSTDARNFIGVLDIYGFEFFEVNSFEQLCINYANEKLQQHFNRQIFKQEQEIYLKEAIKVRRTNSHFAGAAS
jgi:myosin heavy subunit